MNLKTATPREIAEFIVNKDGDNDPVEVFRATRWWGLNMARRKQLNPDFTKLADEAASFVSGLEIQDTYEAIRLGHHTMHTFPEPDINETASFLAVKISTDPDGFTPGMRALAKAYESQCERIADLEEDVERLRPKEAFVPETLFKSNIEGENLFVETECHGGLTVSMSGDAGHSDTVLLPDTATQLATALNKWAGLDGVEWRKVDPQSKPEGRVLLLSGDRISNGHWDSQGWVGTLIEPTHWAPLPKPPVVK